MNTTSPTSADGRGWYEIRLRGCLDARWSTRFEAMTLTTRDGCTVLTGPVDQAALYGLLHQLRDIGLVLVSVNQVGQSDVRPPTQQRATTTSGA